MNRSLPIAVSVLSILAACGSSASWRVVEDEADYEFIWDRFTQIAAVSGYSPDVEATDRALRTYRSKWRQVPAPFRMGSRTRLHGEFERRDEEPGWVVRFHIERQVIDEISAGFEPEEGDWKSASQDYEREEIMLGQLRLALGQELGVQPSYR